MNISCNLAILDSPGKIDSFIEKFTISLNGRGNTIGLSFRCLAGIWSIPAAVLVSRLSKILITSSGTSDKLLDVLRSLVIQIELCHLS